MTDVCRLTLPQDDNEEIVYITKEDSTEYGGRQSQKGLRWNTRSADNNDATEYITSTYSIYISARMVVVFVCICVNATHVPYMRTTHAQMVPTTSYINKHKTS